MKTGEDGARPDISFRSIERDIDRHAERHARLESWSPTPVFRGYEETREYVFNAYLENRSYQAIVDYLLTGWNWNWGSENPFLDRATAALRADGELEKLKRLWRGIIAVQRGHFWELHAISGKPGVEVRDSMSRVKSATLDTMQVFRSILVESGADSAVAQLDGEIALMEAEQRRSVSTRPRKDTVDEHVFWSIIESSAAGADSTGEHIEGIIARLEDHSAIDIKRFQKILDETMARLYHWDVWAVAWIAQDGCSDDAFFGFRNWVILQGRKVFEQLLADASVACAMIPAGQLTNAEGLQSAASIAYEARTGKAMPSRKAKPVKLLGNEWSEEELPIRYPAIQAWYENRWA